MKQLRKKIILLNLKSHPAWVCGLKLGAKIDAQTAIIVTPCVGVWIETVDKYSYLRAIYGHTLRGCVD